MGTTVSLTHVVGHVDATALAEPTREPGFTGLARLGSAEWEMVSRPIFSGPYLCLPSARSSARLSDCGRKA